MSVLASFPGSSAWAEPGNEAMSVHNQIPRGWGSGDETKIPRGSHPGVRGVNDSPA